MADTTPINLTTTEPSLTFEFPIFVRASIFVFGMTALFGGCLAVSVRQALSEPDAGNAALVVFSVFGTLFFVGAQLVVLRRKVRTATLTDTGMRGRFLSGPDFDLRWDQIRRVAWTRDAFPGVPMRVDSDTLPRLAQFDVQSKRYHDFCELVVARSRAAGARVVDAKGRAWADELD